jgi:hypothetical protein
MTSARNREEAMLSRCADVAIGDDMAKDLKVSSALNEMEANVFFVASMIIASKFPCESKKLSAAAEAFFSQNQIKQLPSVEVVRRGWVIGLPRFHDMLCQRIRGVHAA